MPKPKRQRIFKELLEKVYKTKEELGGEDSVQEHQFVPESQNSVLFIGRKLRGNEVLLTASKTGSSASFTLRVLLPSLKVPVSEFEYKGRCGIRIDTKIELGMQALLGRILGKDWLLSWVTLPGKNGLASGSKTWAASPHVRFTFKSEKPRRSLPFFDEVFAWVDSGSPLRVAEVAVQKLLVLDAEEATRIETARKAREDAAVLAMTIGAVQWAFSEAKKQQDTDAKIEAIQAEANSKILALREQATDSGPELIRRYIEAMSLEEWRAKVAGGVVAEDIPNVPKIADRLRQELLAVTRAHPAWQTHARP